MAATKLVLYTLNQDTKRFGLIIDAEADVYSEVSRLVGPFLARSEVAEIVDVIGEEPKDDGIEKACESGCSVGTESEQIEDWYS